LTADHVTLAVPARPEYVRLARLTAASLASRLGFSFDDVEDTRIAVDELCFLLVGSDGRPGEIELEFSFDEGELAIEGRGPGGEVRHEPPDLSFSRQILAALTDEFEVQRSEGAVTFRMVRRRREP
jgi:anti-sigma regulatory factor (Ser/Thr protein kinase)